MEFGHSTSLSYFFSNLCNLTLLSVKKKKKTFHRRLLPRSGRGSRIWSWQEQGWGWCQIWCWPARRWLVLWSDSVQWPAQSMPSSPESLLTPGGVQRLRCRPESMEAAPRPLTPLWRGSLGQRGPAPSSPVSRSVTDSYFLVVYAAGQKNCFSPIIACK